MNQVGNLAYPFPLQRPRTQLAPAPQPQPQPPIQLTTPATAQCEKRKAENLICDTCGVEVNSPTVMETHLRGQKHLKKLKSISNHSTEETAPEPVESNANISTAVNSNVTENSSNNILQWINEIARFNKIVAHYDLVNETGPAHCKVFESRLTFGNEVYLGSGKSIKRAQQLAAEQAFARTTLAKPAHVLRQSNPTKKLPKKKEKRKPKPDEKKVKTPPVEPPIQAESVDQQDALFDEKYQEITEDSDTVEKIHRVVENIERALKSISDKMTEQYRMRNTPAVPAPSSNGDDSSEAFRMLKGAMKISALAMDLYLKSNQQYEIVLVCANKPTRTLLKEIAQELIFYFQQSTNTNPTDGSYRVQVQQSDVCLTVQCSLLPIHVIRILLTATIYSPEGTIEANSDLLDQKKCFEAVTEIQHSNWLSEHMTKDSRTRIILALLCHLQNNRTPLIHLNRWSLILLVHQCENSTLKSLRESFRHIFVCISTGLFLPNCFENVALPDPCKEKSIDAAEYLTTEQRLELTRYAQTVLRHLAFDQVQSIFPRETSLPK